MRRIIWIIASITVVAIGLYIYTAGSDTQGDEDETVEAARENSGGTVTEEDLEEFAEQGLNPFGLSKSQEELTDIDYREYIHGMSHQKVDASEKWGFYEITDSRIQWLLDGLGLEDNKRELTDLDVYKDILERWKAGDFSRVDEDHNVIWEMQGGTVGRATGILSPEEEQEYLQSRE
ncbi:DUF6241 domain-containing protein [Lentibacillus sediminis]|uniref:DUF6241 domain-containing protein n=1 Tax=Lentibacillus sediminis TaxID=1940529 RepID=UPI000C1BEA33|nr:DUF6241 domain-containing protein [Lentibacillus sediminis]